MNLFNRLAVILLSAVLIAGAISLAALAWSMPDQSIDWLRNATGWMGKHNLDLDKSILTAVCALVGLPALALLIWEVTPRSPSVVKVTDLQIGDAVLSTASIGQRVEEAVSQVPHIADARATIKAKRKGIEVALDLHVDPDANLAQVTDEACQAARDVLMNRVHVALASPPTARLHYRELRMRGVPIRRPEVRALPSPIEAPVEAEMPIPPELAKDAPVAEPVVLDRDDVIAEPVAAETVVVEHEAGDTDATVVEPIAARSQPVAAGPAGSSTEESRS